MKICRIKGTVVSTVKHPDYLGLKLLVCQPLDDMLREKGSSFLAVDRVQAGVGDLVLVMREGNGIRQLFQREVTPIRSAIVGIIDHVEVEADERREA